MILAIIIFVERVKLPNFVNNLLTLLFAKNKKKVAYTHNEEEVCIEISSVRQFFFCLLLSLQPYHYFFFRTMLARWHDLQRKEAGKGIKVLYCRHKYTASSHTPMYELVIHRKSFFSCDVTDFY